MVESNRRRRARYRDVIAAPEWFIAEIIDGELYLSPRPGLPHAHGITSLVMLLGGSGGPGGWFFLFEPELHLGRNVVVPDLAAWRRERMPDVRAKFATLPPAWLCEGLSNSTAKHDRARKLPIYAKAGVEFVWLVSPTEWTLEVYGLAEGRYELVQLFRDDEVIRAQPFEQFELRMSQIASLPFRASEPPIAYRDRPILFGTRAFDLVDRYEASPAR